MKTHRFLPIPALLFIPWLAAHAASPVVELQLSPTAIARITPTEVIPPAGAEGNYYPAMQVAGDTTAGGSPSRLVFEFPLGGLADVGFIRSAAFSATAFGGAAGMGVLTYALFGYEGTGGPGLDSGAAGTQLAGPFTYHINSSVSADLRNLDVTDFIRSLVASGASHAGFVFRDINTPPDFRTPQQYIVVQDSPYWAGDVPPSLTLTIIPEPQALQLSAALGCLLAARRRRVRA